MYRREEGIRDWGSFAIIVAVVESCIRPSMTSAQLACTECVGLGVDWPGTKEGTQEENLVKRQEHLGESK